MNTMDAQWKNLLGCDQNCIPKWMLTMKKKKTAKGISKRSSARLLRQKTYYNALYYETRTIVTKQQNRYIGHTLYSMRLMKTGLFLHDDMFCQIKFLHLLLDVTNQATVMKMVKRRPVHALPLPQVPFCVLVWQARKRLSNERTNKIWKWAFHQAVKMTSFS